VAPLFGSARLPADLKSCAGVDWPSIILRMTPKECAEPLTPNSAAYGVLSKKVKSRLVRP
jgi:hypothetical protein